MASKKQDTTVDDVMPEMVDETVVAMDPATVEYYEQPQYVDPQYVDPAQYHQQYLDEPRRADVTIARVDAWTVLKASFLVSIALAIAMVVMAILLWFVLDAMGVFGAIEDFLLSLNAKSFLGLLEYARLPRVISYATILGVANVVIFTAMSALAALLYNLIAALVGGVRVSLMDE